MAGKRGDSSSKVSPALQERPSDVSNAFFCPCERREYGITLSPQTEWPATSCQAAYSPVAVLGQSYEFPKTIFALVGGQCLLMLLCAASHSQRAGENPGTLFERYSLLIPPFVKDDRAVQCTAVEVSSCRQPLPGGVSPGTLTAEGFVCQKLPTVPGWSFPGKTLKSAQMLICVVPLGRKFLYDWITTKNNQFEE